MNKIFKTLLDNFKYYFLYFLLIPILVSFVVYVIILLTKYKKSKEELSFKDFIKLNIFERKNLITVIPILYAFILYHSTVTNRIITGQTIDPLSNVFGGWTITELQFFYDLSSVWNVVMFLPLTIIIVMFFKHRKGIEYSYFKNIIISSLLSFFMSLVIEFSQMLFHCGTFQISDLFYNTLGGFLGALIYILVVKFIKSKRTVSM